MVIRVDTTLKYCGLILLGFLVNLFADLFLNSWLVFGFFAVSVFFLKDFKLRLNFAFWLGIWLSLFEARPLGGYSLIFILLAWVTDKFGIRGVRV